MAASVAYALVCGGGLIKWQLNVSRAQALFKKPSATQWSKDGIRYRVMLRHQKLGEKERYTIAVHGKNGIVVFERQAEIYTGSLLSGGFVRAVQVDDDPELEIVVWGSLASGWSTQECSGKEVARAKRHARRRQFKSSYDRRSFYLDFRDGAVSEQPFCRASTHAKEQASQWAYHHLKTPVHILGVVFLATVGMLFPALLFFLIARRKRRNA